MSGDTAVTTAATPDTSPTATSEPSPPSTAAAGAAAVEGFQVIELVGDPSAGVCVDGVCTVPLLDGDDGADSSG